MFITMSDGVAQIGRDAFYGCISLKGVFCMGNAPVADLTVFLFALNATVYHLPGTTGWGGVFAGRPTALWMLPTPVILRHDPRFGAKTNGFGFTISWATNLSVVVEATTNLAKPVWTPLATNSLTSGTNYFSDSQWMNYPSRFYRVHSQ